MESREMAEKEGEWSEYALAHIFAYIAFKPGKEVDS
jgi:3-methyladenine DNA glycosylase/8-oxoguanine DNA glycosylase